MGNMLKENRQWGKKKELAQNVEGFVKVWAPWKNICSRTHWANNHFSVETAVRKAAAEEV